MPLWPQRLYFAAIIATCQLNEASLPLDTLQLSRSNVNSMVHSYLSSTPVRVGVGTSLIWAVDQTLLHARVWLRETKREQLLNSPTSAILTVAEKCNVRHPSSVIEHPSSNIRHPSSVIRHLVLVGTVMGVACLIASAHVF